jgi:hypothetical protein
MKRLIVLSLVVLTAFGCLFAQTSKSPFSQYGYKKQVMYTSSKGEFEEFHRMEDVVEIGSVFFNTKTNTVVGYINKTDIAEVASATSAMSVDPLCEKYYWISPYAYCMNNPVKYTDPTGKWIAGSDGKPVYFNNGQWTKRMGNAMLKSGTASRQLFGMMNNTAMISVEIKNEVVKGADGGYTMGKTFPGKVFVDKEGTISKVEGYKIEIYEGSINEVIGKSNSSDNVYSGLTADEGIAVNASHESVHTELENTQQNYDNLYRNTKNDLEAQPNKEAEKASEEIRVNKKIGQ